MFRLIFIPANRIQKFFYCTEMDFYFSISELFDKFRIRFAAIKNFFTYSLIFCKTNMSLRDACRIQYCRFLNIVQDHSRAKVQPKCSTQGGFKNCNIDIDKLDRPNRVNSKFLWHPWQLLTNAETHSWHKWKLHDRQRVSLDNLWNPWNVFNESGAKELVNGNVWPEEADGGKAKKCHRSYHGSFRLYLTGAG